jgi:Icc protein
VSPLPLTVLQLTDLHLLAAAHGTVKGVDTDASFAAVLERAAAEPADLVLLTGDLVHDGSEAGYRRLAEYFAEADVPVLALPGNHDDPAVMDRVLAQGAVRRDARWPLGDWTLVLLDSFAPGRVGGRLGEAELARLADLLDHTHGPVLIAVHHPAVAPAGGGVEMALEDEGALWRVLEGRDQVKGIVWGHVHQELDQWRGATRIMATPSTCAQFRLLPEGVEVDPAPPGYRRLDLYPDGSLETWVERVNLSEPR